MATANTKVGPITAADASENVIRAGKAGEVITSHAHGRYYEACYRGKMFYSYVTAQTLTASNTTYTGHVVWNGSNQTGSGVNLVLTKIGVGVSVTSATMTGIALGMSSGQTSAPTGTTAATQAGSLFLSSQVGQGLSYKAATLSVAGTPLIPLLHNTAAINTVGVDQFGLIDIEGAIVVPPAYTAHLLALGAASAASAVTSGIWWEEVPV